MSLYLHLLDQLDAMVRDGRGLASIETWIEGWPLTEEQKSALWLYAWRKLPDADVQAETLATLTGLG